MTNARLRTLALAAALASAAPAAAADPYRELLNKVPADANALILVDVKALHNSALGRKEEWAKKHETCYHQEVCYLPPSVQDAVLASEWDHANLGNRWALALVKMDKHVSTADIAGREGGTVEEVQGRNVTLSRRNSYIANVAPDAFGVMSPATRPTLVRWLKSVAANKQPVVSEFLQAAIEPADARPPFLLALDLTDALD